MRAVNLDRRIVIQTFTEAVDTSGQPIRTWTTLATVWASKMDITGRERFASRQELAEETTVFRIRWRSDLTPEMRITYDSKVYDIEGLAEIGRHEYMDITGRAEVPA